MIEAGHGGKARRLIRRRQASASPQVSMARRQSARVDKKCRQICDECEEGKRNEFTYS